ncbi:hypothetical protein ACO1O0_003549 [Amphichorda felina]
MGKLPSPLSLAPTRATLQSSTHSATSHPLCRTSSASQVRHATFIRRPRRPYTFTQLVQLSDGSSYTVRTTSPQPLYRAAKDSRNSLLWQPSEKSLRNVELDEAGKLAAFRERFGRAFDQQQQAGEADQQGQAAQEQHDDYADLISSYAPDMSSQMKESTPEPTAPAKKKK